MRRYVLPGLLLVLIASWIRADETPAAKEAPPARKVIEEQWHAAYFEGVRAGYVHSTITERITDGVKLIHTTRDVHLLMRRYKAIVPMHVEAASLEKLDGKAIGLSFTQHLDKERKLTIIGRVKGDKLVVTSSADERKVEVPWPEDAIGLYHQERIFRERKLKPGDTMHFVNFELAMMKPTTVRVTARPEETVDLLITRKEDEALKVSRTPVKLLRVEQVPDKIDLGGSKFQPPTMVSWLDKDLQPVRYEWEFPGIGWVTLYQTTKEVALKEDIAPALLPDLGLNTLVTVKAELPRPYDSKNGVYRITVKGDSDAATSFARDGRQEAREARANSFELHVKATGADKGPRLLPDEEYLKSSYFLDSDEAHVKEVATRLVGKKDDPAGSARRIERWVHENMKPSNAIGFATASQVCKDLKGDCRQHAMLTAALCRAAGIPARTAVGLIYVHEPSRKPVFIFHMWTEVLLDGRWHGLDATLGKGGLSACHLKVADHSWRDTQTLSPLLPVARLLGKLEIEVVEVK
jgi:transglutaminase-like putative cysteine protease